LNNALRHLRTLMVCWPPRVAGFFHMTRRAVELISQAGRGHVVTVGSSLVDQPMNSVPGVLTSLTKGALNAATRALAIEHDKNGVRVNAVSAGTIKTPMHALEIHPFFASLHPMGRIGEISEIVDATLISTRRNSSPEKFFTSTEGRRPAITRYLVFEGPAHGSPHAHDGRIGTQGSYESKS
jgi:NAD(P)-dependent dehydrogenase (short-subunit alcohol dehydrogenase family)